MKMCRAQASDAVDAGSPTSTSGAVVRLLAASSWHYGTLDWHYGILDCHDTLALWYSGLALWY